MDNNWNGSGIYNPTQHNATNESATPVDNQAGSVNATIVDSTTDNDVLNNPQSSSRVNQQQVLPSAIKGRLMQPVSDNGGVILTSSLAVVDGTSSTAILTTTSNNKGLLIAEVYWQIYIDVISNATKMPQAISSRLYPFYTWNPLYDTLGVAVSTQPSKTLSAIQVRNAVGDGSTHIIIVQSYLRAVVNGSGQHS